MTDEQAKPLTPEQVQEVLRSIVGSQPVPAVSKLIRLTDYINEAAAASGIYPDPHASSVEDAKNELRSALSTLRRVIPIVVGEIDRLVLSAGSADSVRIDNAEHSLEILDRLGKAAAETEMAAVPAATLFGDPYRSKPGPDARRHQHAVCIAGLVERALLDAGWKRLGLQYTGGATRKLGPALSLVMRFLAIIDPSVREPGTVAKAIADDRKRPLKQQIWPFSEDLES